MASKTSVVDINSATSHSSSEDETRSDPFDDSASFRKEPPHYHGLSICCYAPLQPYMQHFTCSDCSTVFNKVNYSFLSSRNVERGHDSERGGRLLWDGHFSIWTVQGHAWLRVVSNSVRTDEGIRALPTRLLLCQEWSPKETGIDDFYSWPKTRLVSTYLAFGGALARPRIQPARR